MNPRRQRRQAINFVKQMILNNDVEIKPGTGTIESLPGYPEKTTTYSIRPKKGTILARAPKWFDGKDVTAVLLVQEEGLFFPNFALKINNNAFDIPVRKAHQLYDQVESAKKQSSQQPVKTM